MHLAFTTADWRLERKLLRRLPPQKQSNSLCGLLCMAVFSKCCLLLLTARFASQAMLVSIAKRLAER